MKGQSALSMLRPALAGLAALLSSAVGAQASSHAQHHPAVSQHTPLETPPSIALEHRELHQTLEEAAKEKGALGAAARELEKALSPHFRREEEIATPPLSMLPALARSEPTTEMRSVIPLTQALERELPQMLREHELIRAAASRFRDAAKSNGRADYVRFSDELAAHARQEEEILYPAAILVGRYVARLVPER